MSSTYNDLTDDQKRLHDDVEQTAFSSGDDLADVLATADATAVDKAAVAEVFGGPGAGRDYL